MVTRRSKSFACGAVLLIFSLWLTGQAPKVFGVISGPVTPSWIRTGDYVEYNQTLTIGSSTASIIVNDTFLENGSASMRIQRLDARVPSGFPEPGLVAPYDSASEFGYAVVTTTVNGKTSTRTISAMTGFATDLTALADSGTLAYTNATLDQVRVHVLGSPRVQAWRVNEHLFYAYIGAPPVLNKSAAPNSLVWFEKDTLMKIRESNNYTDPYDNYVISVETIENTNVPQLKSALASQQTYSTGDSTSSFSASTTATATTDSPSDAYEGLAIVSAVVVLLAVSAFYVARAAKHRDAPSRNPAMSIVSG